MSPRTSFLPVLFLAALLLMLDGCATAPQAPSRAAMSAAPIDPPRSVGAPTAPRTIAATAAPDKTLEDRILAIDPDRVSARDVATLAGGPTPRIVLLHGGIYPVHLVMESFGEFLVGMGYPEAKIRDPESGEWSYSPYDYTRRLAGIVAWNYEHDGLRPMLVGHSQGGLYVVKILKELAGQYSPSVPVWNVATGTEEPRTSIVDPLTGRERPVVGLSVAYASVLGAGGWALVLPNQWDNLLTLRKIPDTVEDFTGFFIGVDLFAWSFPGNPFDTPYVATGTAHIRNVMLPSGYNHVMLPNTAELAQNAQVRDWVNAYLPDTGADPSSLPGDAPSRVLWAADVWHSVKKHWCLEAQAWIRARRAAH